MITENRRKETLIKTVDLCKTYSSGNEQFLAAKSINLEVYKGDFTVIMGSSGSGKSTLLYLLSGLDGITSGEVIFKGQRIDEYSEKEITDFRSNKIGYVYQSINLIPDFSLLENVAFPGYVAGRSKKDVNKQALDLLNRIGIGAQAERLPSQVSGGQQQRAAIARALINSPEVIFADEPTGALSQEQGAVILDLLTEMNQNNQSIVMVTHDIKAACRADRLVLVKDGTIEGILELGKYSPDKLKARENQIFMFMSGKEG
ncbi:Lipoprotein-releasing system ATP-binding protein LolD [Paenibacillus sp. JJ-100]|uniref:ABC transporter ATP-binding protein n=1 Tax=Paenibacillus sp. JJ-100 TaxID=2974896 RepID=UPI0022FF4FA3|nr:ABC transporter ATP-binding protein [Paenibacillus sp. JJ-100]CAI6068681.1 Lipoprotein-releasing system ATP-binding protein LolD [Paenibacillus sp. JJ-100]